MDTSTSPNRQLDPNRQREYDRQQDEAKSHANQNPRSGSSLSTGELIASFSRILSLAKPYSFKLAASTLLSLVSVALALALPIGMRQLTNLAIGRPDRAVIDKLAILLFVLFAARAALNFVGMYLLRWTGDRIVADLRVKAYKRLLELSVGFFTEQRMGDITSRLTNDVAAVRSAVADSIIALVYQAAKFIGVVTLMIVLNRSLAGTLLIIIPLATLVSRHFGNLLREYARRVQEHIGRATAIAHEALGAIRLVKVFTRERYELSRFAASVEEIFLSSRRLAFFSSLSGSAVDLLFSAGTLAIFWYGGIQVFSHHLSVGDLVAFLYCSQLLSQSVNELSQVYGTFTMATGAAERLFELLDSRAEVMDTGTAVAPKSVTGEIVFEEVHFSYAIRPVLHNLCFRVSAGERIAVVGPSGAGKSTMLSLIPRLYNPTSGRILLDGRDIRSIPLLFLRRQVAVVSQETELFSGSVMDNIRYGQLAATDDQVEEAARAANAHSFILDLLQGYRTEIGERGIKLSGGQRQRIAIARALLKNARILILDEATSSVDSQAETLIQEAILRLTQSRTTFIIAHRLSTVQSADCILVMNGGQIVETGTHDRLLANRGLYFSLAALGFRDRPAEMLVAT